MWKLVHLMPIQQKWSLNTVTPRVLYAYSRVFLLSHPSTNSLNTDKRPSSFPCDPSLQADVVFEEDKGFWAAVQSFINTTKRPIVLTTSDPGISDLVDGRHEITTLKLPPSVSVFSHAAHERNFRCCPTRTSIDFRCCPTRTSIDFSFGPLTP